MHQVYDTIIIGAGIAGASTAYFLRKKGQKVLVVDKRGIARGGSGAAGAFVSPKIGKGSVLQQLTNEAFTFARAFYQAYFPEYYHQTGVIRIPKDDDDAQKFTAYEAYNTNKYEKMSSAKLLGLGIHTPYESFCFDEAGVCDATALCEALLEGIDMLKIEVQIPLYSEGLWQVEGYQSKNLVLSTGYENSFFDMRYMGVRGTWGTRGDFVTSQHIKVSLHQSLSVSATFDGIIKLGATHEKLIKEPRACEDEQALSLRQRATGIVDVSDFVLKASFCGMRAGSKDYFPLLGRVIDTEYMLTHYPDIVRGAKPQLKYKERLFVCNGLGARGFVFGPMMGKMLSELIIDDEAVDPRVDADRLFLKWCRRSDTSCTVSASL